MGSTIIAARPVRYNYAGITVQSGSTIALAANAKRQYAKFTNISNERICLHVGQAAESNVGEILNPVDADGNVRGVFEMTVTAGNLSLQDVYAICASGSKGLLVTEGVTN